MSFSNRRGSFLLLASLSIALGACGGDGDKVTGTCGAGTTGTPPNCTPIAPPCTQTVVESGAGVTEARTLYFDDFSLPDTGRLDMTLDWTLPTSPIGLYVTPANTCSLAEFNARTCNFLVRSEPSTVKPRKISTPNFAAGNYRWIVANFSNDFESLSFQFVLSKGTCPPLAGGSPSALAADDGEPRQAERVVHR